MKLCETCAHYRECGTRLVVNVMENDIQCKAYKEKVGKEPKTYRDKKDGCQKKQEKEKKYRNLIICGFPGVGKSTAAELCRSALDLESTPFHFVSDQADYFTENSTAPYFTQMNAKENPNWVSDYVDEIEKAANDPQYNFILVSTHKKVREEMQYRGIPYIIVTPLIKLKDEYLAKYVRRGDSYKFIEALHDKWEKWIEDFVHDDMPIIHLESGENISKLLPIHPMCR